MKPTELELALLNLIVVLTARIQDMTEEILQSQKLFKDRIADAEDGRRAAGKLLLELFPNASGDGSWSLAEIRDEIKRLYKIDRELNAAVAEVEAKQRARQKARRKGRR